MKKVFITGGTTGIGLALAQKYLDQGAWVGICGRDLTKLDSSIQYHPRLKCYQVDVTDFHDLKVSLANFEQWGGLVGIDIMVANAGISLGSKKRLPDFQLSRKIFDVNLTGVLNAFELALPSMLNKKSGQLVAIGSVAGMVGLPGASAYCASKAAVNIMCESLAIDLRAENIAVTCIAPGFIDTPLTQKNDHGMPFIMSAKKGAEKIYQAIEKKKVWYIFPWQMFLLISFLQKLPRCGYRFLMQLPFLNYSRE